MKQKVNLFWFRRDLRLQDNAGLYHALKSNIPVIVFFVFDKNILNTLNKQDHRISFIQQSLVQLNLLLKKHQSTLEVFYDVPKNVISSYIEKYEVEKVFCNHDTDEYSLQRDNEIKELLKKKNIEFISCKDHLIFEKNEILKLNNEPYTVFTPYSKKWKEKIKNSFYYKSYPTEKYLQHLLPNKFQEVLSIEKLGFEKSASIFPSSEIKTSVIQEYNKTRDFPALKGTSRLGIHLRFGTISIRKLVSIAIQKNETFLNELIWRDFFHSISWHFPRVRNYKAFKQEYDLIEWRNNETEFKLWCNGKTGYPIVDAGMRELNATGFMHNRVRMITASFLIKHLLIDWRWGEQYFADKLLDFDFASNNGNWQWVAGCGCDAAPYFRIFNPELQTKKFDADFSYIKKWIPEFETKDYCLPIVNHAFARKRCLDAYKKIKN
jgi:deoxyribodipyrimidine photo-lyase